MFAGGRSAFWAEVVQQEVTITIETYELAQIGSSTLAQAEQLATSVFATAGAMPGGPKLTGNVRL